MKNIVAALIMLLFLLCLASCLYEKPDYEIVPVFNDYLSDESPGYENSSSVQVKLNINYKKIIIEDALKNRTIKINGIDYFLEYVYSKESDISNIRTDHYSVKNVEDCVLSEPQISFISGTNKIAGIYGISLRKADEQIFSEEELKQIAYDEVSKYVDLSIYNSVEIIKRTDLKKLKDYDVVYSIKTPKFATSEQLTVRIDWNGNIIYFKKNGDDYFKNYDAGKLNINERYCESLIRNELYKKFKINDYLMINDTYLFISKDNRHGLIYSVKAEITKGFPELCSFVIYLD